MHNKRAFAYLFRWAISSSFLVVVSSVFGCGPSVRSAGVVEQIQGQVVTADGTPIPAVLLVLQPTEAGYVTEIEVGPDGRFSGEAIAGKYAYYLLPSKVAKKGIPKNVSAAFTEPNKANLVEVRSGVEITCKVN